MAYRQGFDDGAPDVYHKAAWELIAPHAVQKRVLNLGCWTGALERLTQHGSCRMVGLDLSHHALAEARRHAPWGCWINGAVQQLPFGAETFDLVTALMVLEHLPRGEEPVLFREVARILRPGGVLICTTPQWQWFAVLCDPAYWLTGHRHYSVRQLGHFANQAGLEVERIERRGRLLGNLAHPLFYLGKYLLRINILKIPAVEQRLAREYAQPGYRDLMLVARKP